jgi:hypothetical protein
MWSTDDSQQPPPAAPPNADGRALAMTVFSLLRPGGAFVQRVLFAIGRRRPPTDVRALGSIHYARLGIIRRVPDHGQPEEHVRQPLQLFETNYNGTFDQYIDSFVDAVPWKMRAFWGTSYGFPWRLALQPFKRFIHANEFPIDHYYAAYPGATTKMVGAALRIADAHAQFHRHAARLGPDAFADEYRSFVTRVQGDL